MNLIRAIILVAAIASAAMAATFTDVTQDGINLQDISLVNQILASAAVRIEIGEQGPVGPWLALVEAGYIIHDAQFSPSTCRTLQYEFEAEDWGTWVRTNTLADVVPLGTFPAENQFPRYTNIVELYADAGMSTNGWRRATNWDPSADDWTDLDDPMWTRDGNGFGQFQAEDIYGPWLLDDLQRAYNQPRGKLVFRSGLDWVRPASGPNEWTASLGTYTTSWAVAKSALTAIWPSSAVSNTAAPVAYYPGKAYEISGVTKYAIFTARTRAARLELTVSQPFLGLGGSIQYYAVSRTPPAVTWQVYDAGVWPLVEDQFASFGSSTYAAATNASASVYSPVLGSTDEPPAADEPQIAVDDGNTARGWEARGGYEAAIIWPVMPFVR